GASPATVREGLIQVLLDFEARHVSPRKQRDKWVAGIVTGGLVLFFFSPLLFKIADFVLRGLDAWLAILISAVLGLFLAWFGSGSARVRIRRKCFAEIHCRLAAAARLAGYPLPLAETSDRDLLAAGWQIVRWIEEKHLPRSADVCISSPSRFWMAG